MRNSFEERLNRMKHLSQINEAKYNLVDNIEEDDVVPDDIWVGTKPETAGLNTTIFEDDDEEDTSEEIPSGDTPEDVDTEQQTGEELPVDDGDTSELGADPMSEPQPKSQEEVQNDILKLNVAALEKMQNVIDNIEMSLSSIRSNQDQISQVVGSLSSEVEEVKEPTNVEKLQQRKEDSHPYYYNLNNMWNGNSFQARMDQAGEQGIKKLDDGTYVAYFDDLPKHTDHEIRDSFKNF